MSPDQDISTWEKHGQTLLTSLILLCILWVINQTSEQAKFSIYVTGEIKALNTRIDGLASLMETAAAKRYTSADAERDAKLRDLEHTVIDRRIKALELALSK